MTLAKQRILITVIVLTGFILRFWNISDLAIDHFDEGVYAFAGQWIFEPSGLRSLDPGVIAYAPPVTPLLIGLSYFFLGGASDLAAIFPSLICGSLSILIIYWFSQKLFGTQSGLVAAALLSSSGLNIAFSRSALTDMPLVMIWLLTMLAGLNFLEKPRFRTAIVMGFCVGLCQLTKYNGFLTGVIVAITAILQCLSSLIEKGYSQTEINQLKKRLFWGLFAIGIALTLYFPWFQFVERNGGYAALMKHHSGYLHPVEKWPTHLWLQWLEQATFSTLLTRIISLVLIMFVLFISQMREDSGFYVSFKLFKARWNIPVLILAVILPNGFWGLSLLLCPELWKSQNLGKRLAVVWFLFMTALTPFYHPYARLWLPTHLICLIMASSLMSIEKNDSLVIQWVSFRKGNPIRLQKIILILILPLALISVFAGISTTNRNPDLNRNIWSGKSGLRREVRQLAPEIEKRLNRGTQISMLVSPAVKWQLQMELNQREVGLGRISMLSSIDDFQLGRGALLVDQSLLNPIEFEKLSLLRNSRPAQIDAEERFPVSRGLITVLDHMPDVLQRSTLPAMKIELID